MIHESLRIGAHAMAGELTRLRHDLHRHPEIGLDLPRTQDALAAQLSGLGMEVSRGTPVTSLTAVLRGTSPDRREQAVLLRADMDALPVQEATGLPYASETDGAMHACGHDLHMAMLVGAARLLSAHRDLLDGDVVLMFQPGEEGWNGAGKMLDEGVLDAAGPRVRSAHAMHVMSAKLPRGVFGGRPGTMMAASDQLAVTVHGRGGHGSEPHTTLDPIAAIAEMVTAMHTLVTRRFDVFDPVVITVGSLHGGTKRNIIPDEAMLEATIRSFSTASRKTVRSELPRLCRAIAEAFGVDVTVDYADEYPRTVNDPAELDLVAETVRDTFGRQRYVTLPTPEPGAEDFSRVLAEVPGSYIFLGATPSDDHRTAPSNHSPRAAFSDDVLPLGALLHAQVAVASLARTEVSA